MDGALRQRLREQLAVRLDEAARALGIGPQAARAAIRRGELESTGVGRNIRIPTAPLRRRLGLDKEAAL
jgi:excisionase family DNA binding protein